MHNFACHAKRGTTRRKPQPLQAERMPARSLSPDLPNPCAARGMEGGAQQRVLGQHRGHVVKGEAAAKPVNGAMQGRYVSDLFRVPAALFSGSLTPPDSPPMLTQQPRN